MVTGTRLPGKPVRYAHPELGPVLHDLVDPARFPRALLRWRHQRWAERDGWSAFVRSLVDIEALRVRLGLIP